MSKRFITATYYIQTQDKLGALNALTRGQSVGNPTIKTPFETPAFLDKWQATAKVLSDSLEGGYWVEVHWPEHNFGKEGVNYLLSVLMGGQCDIDLIESCVLTKLNLSTQQRFLPGPRYGIPRIREMLGVYDRAFCGGIIKPKIGLSPRQLAEVVKRMADGGCDFIKEDEILADQYWCPMRKRLPLVAKALAGYKMLYAPCITADGSEAWKKARIAKELGATAIHLNIWCGLGTYLDVCRHVDLPLFFQKSGDKVWTTGPYSISFEVLCQLAHLIGCDIAHVGMFGGYLAEDVGTLKRRMLALKTTLPSFSCGMTPQLAERCVEQFGIDLMVTSGGWIHGQSDGVVQAVRRLKQSCYPDRSPLAHAGRLVDRQL